ncbi:hypothetical protein [Scytonema sp. PCC 10023]|uniref:hypothetical protein n=1 Tax=Scytonema sp. PCC 10023 TaxID=1680591 RepID=UPI0039C66D28
MSRALPTPECNSKEYAKQYAICAPGSSKAIAQKTVREGEIVWEYINPYFGNQNAPGESALVARSEQNSVFRAFRYAPEQVPWL